MSKSYKKNIRLFCCTGSNTDFYRSRTRKMRRIHNNHLRNIISNYPIDDVDDLISFKDFVRTDYWREPTDGHWVYTKSENTHNKKLLNNNSSQNHWVEVFVNKANRYFKPKTRKHGKENIKR